MKETIAKKDEPLAAGNTPDLMVKESGKSAPSPVAEGGALQEMADTSDKADHFQSMQNLADTFVQAKYTISSPGDPLEIEADHVAHQVVHADPDVQSKESNKQQEKEETPLVQPKIFASGRAGGEDNQIDRSIDSSLSGGAPLGGPERSFFEPRFGTDFDNVRIHTNSQAARAASSINAKAFTKGNDIAFARGEYQPGTSEGKELIAHELTHVVQQGGGINRAADIYRQETRPPYMPEPMQDPDAFNPDLVVAYLNVTLRLIKEVAASKAKGEYVPIEKIYSIIFNLGEVAYELSKPTKEFLEENPLVVEGINTLLETIKFTLKFIVPEEDLNKAGWIDLMLIYTFEMSKERKLYITDPDSPTILDLKSHEKIRELRRRVVTMMYKTGDSEFNFKDHWSYKFKHMKEHFQLKLGLLELFLGSFQVTASSEVEPDGQVKMDFEVYNISRLESLTRFRTAEGDSGNRGILEDKELGEGIHIGGTIEQYFKWTEIFDPAQVDELNREYAKRIRSPMDAYKALKQKILESGPVEKAKILAEKIEDKIFDDLLPGLIDVEIYRIFNLLPTNVKKTLLMAKLQAKKMLYGFLRAHEAEKFVFGKIVQFIDSIIWNRLDPVTQQLIIKTVAGIVEKIWPLETGITLKAAASATFAIPIMAGAEGEIELFHPKKHQIDLKVTRKFDVGGSTGISGGGDIKAGVAKAALEAGLDVKAGFSFTTESTFEIPTNTKNFVMYLIGQGGSLLSSMTPLGIFSSKLLSLMGRAYIDPYLKERKFEIGHFQEYEGVVQAGLDSGKKRDSSTGEKSESIMEIIPHAVLKAGISLGVGVGISTKFEPGEDIKHGYDKSTRWGVKIYGLTTGKLNAEAKIKFHKEYGLPTMELSPSAQFALFFRLQKGKKTANDLELTAWELTLAGKSGDHSAQLTLTNNLLDRRKKSKGKKGKETDGDRGAMTVADLLIPDFYNFEFQFPVDLPIVKEWIKTQNKYLKYFFKDGNLIPGILQGSIGTISITYTKVHLSMLFNIFLGIMQDAKSEARQIAGSNIIAYYKKFWKDLALFLSHGKITGWIAYAGYRSLQFLDIIGSGEIETAKIKTFAGLNLSGDVKVSAGKKISVEGELEGVVFKEFDLLKDKNAQSLYNHLTKKFDSLLQLLNVNFNTKDLREKLESLSAEIEKERNKRPFSRVSNSAIAAGAEALASNKMVEKSLRNFSEVKGEGNWRFFFSVNPGLGGAFSRPDKLDSLEDYEGLESWQQQHTILQLAFPELTHNQIEEEKANRVGASMLDDIKRGYRKWPVSVAGHNVYAVFQKGTTELSATCNILVGDSLYLAGIDTSRNGKYYSAEAIFYGYGPFRIISSDEVMPGDIDAIKTHVDVVVSVDRDSNTKKVKSFVARNGYLGGKKRDRFFSQGWVIRRVGK